MPHARERLWLIAYDIADDRQRYRVERLLADVGRRLQYSVFTCLLDRRALARLKSRLGRHVDRSTDSVRLYPICRPCWAHNQQRGIALPDDRPDHWEI